MKRVIDFSGKYKGGHDEHVVRGNIRFMRPEDLKEYDKIVANETDRELFEGVDGVSFVKSTTKSGGKQGANNGGGRA